MYSGPHAPRLYPARAGAGLRGAAGKADGQHPGGQCPPGADRRRTRPAADGLSCAALHSLLLHAARDPRLRAPGPDRHRRAPGERGLLAHGPQFCPRQLARQPGREPDDPGQVLPRHGHPLLEPGAGAAPQLLWLADPLSPGERAGRRARPLHRRLSRRGRVPLVRAAPLPARLHRLAGVGHLRGSEPGGAPAGAGNGPLRALRLPLRQ